MNLLVIGLGKLGLPLAALLAEAGHQVFGYDNSNEVVSNLQIGKYAFFEKDLSTYMADGVNNLHFVSSFSQITDEIDIIFIIVPTPSTEKGHFSNHNLISVLGELANSLEELQKNRKLVINIVSTVMPGSCVGELMPFFEEKASIKFGDEIGFCYNPEFIALGSVIHDMQFPDMHLIGASSEWAGLSVLEVLGTIVKKKVPSNLLTLTEAEVVKISVNNFVTMKISYANLLQQICEKIGDVDIDKVTSSIGLDSRIGAKYLKAAAPYGGPCFPRDTRALSALFEDYGIENHLSIATEQTNLSHLKFLVDKILSIATRGVIGVAGISYKPGTALNEESPGINIASSLKSLGRDVITWDEFGSFDSRFDSTDNLTKFISSADFIVITRPIDKSLLSQLHAQQKPYLDLWRAGTSN